MININKTEELLKGDDDIENYLCTNSGTHFAREGTPLHSVHIECNHTWITILMISGRFITGQFNTVGSSCGQFNTRRFIPECEKQLAVGAA